MLRVRLYRISVTILLLWIRPTVAAFNHILQVLVYKDIHEPHLPECSTSSIETLASDVRDFLQKKVTNVVHDDDFIIGNVEGTRNMPPSKGDGPAVEMTFHLKCTFCNVLGYSLRSDNPNSNYNVAYMLRWALQYYLEENISRTTDDSIKECLTDEFRILVKVTEKNNKKDG
jgi:hypothetical protein